jgi:hypothetical protein
MKYKIQIKVLSATIPDVIHNAPYICGGCAGSDPPKLSSTRLSNTLRSIV